MNYTVRKILFFIGLSVTAVCGYIGHNLSIRHDTGAGIYVTIFITGIIVCYVGSFFIHDPNDGSDY